MTEWMELVMKIKKEKGCSLSEAMKQAKKIYHKGK
jgi:mannose/cellobiose epimerase-like protein (N-acyl-D-glucosamine 2-epimerase family)